MAFKLTDIDHSQKGKTVGSGIESLLKKEITFFGKRLSSKTKYAFYNELAVLTEAGITIRESLVLIKNSQKNQKQIDILEEILGKVVSGIPFSEALHETGFFSEYEYYSLRIGEETGTLAKICRRLATFFERKNEQRRVVISALTYPAIVLSTAILVVIFMLSYVVPMFEDIFRQNKIELPFLTRVIIHISDGIKTYGLLFALLLGILFFVARFFKDNRYFKEILHHALLRMPMVGPFITKVYLAQFMQAVSLLTSSKITLLDSLQMVRQMIAFVPLQQSLQQVEEGILRGQSLSDSLKGRKMFDDRLVTLVKVAEETNKTEFVFNQLNEQYNQELIQQSKMISTFLEPFIILIVGGIIGVLLIAMYLPMFQLSSAIG